MQELRYRATAYKADGHKAASYLSGNFDDAMTFMNHPINSGCVRMVIETIDVSDFQWKTVSVREFLR